MTFLTVLNRLFELALSWIPLPEIVRPDQELIEFVFGKYIRKFGAGFYIRWELIATYETVPIKRDTVKIFQEFKNQDKVSTTGIESILVYEVSNSVLLVTQTYDYTQTISDIMQLAQKEMFAPEGFFSIEALGRKSDKELAALVQSQLEEYGVKVIRAGWTSVSTARSLILRNKNEHV